MFRGSDPVDYKEINATARITRALDWRRSGRCGSPRSSTASTASSPSSPFERLSCCCLGIVFELPVYFFGFLISDDETCNMHREVNELLVIR